MTIAETVDSRRKDILRVAASHGARNVRLFGSVARGDAGEESDVDFLVDLNQDRSLLDLGRLVADLEDLLGRRVDVATPQSLHWFIRDRVFREAVPL